jgi:hypothetical protein
MFIILDVASSRLKIIFIPVLFSWLVTNICQIPAKAAALIYPINILTKKNEFKYFIKIAI